MRQALHCQAPLSPYDCCHSVSWQTEKPSCRAAEKAAGGKQQRSPDAAAEAAAELDTVHGSAANEGGSAAEDAADAAAAKAVELHAPPPGTLVAAFSAKARCVLLIAVVLKAACSQS